MRKNSIARIFALALVLATAIGAAVLAAPATASQRPAHTWVPVQLGQPAGPSSVLRAGRNVNVTNKSGAQSETTVAIDPTNKNHILTASNDLSGQGSAHIYESFDGGKTWTDAGLGLSGLCYDPWLDFNASGDAFFAYECSDQRIAYRKVGQTTWTKTLLNNAGGFPDRDMVVVDTGSGSPFKGRVYIGYDDAGANNAAFLLTSANGFGSWTRTPKINGTSSTIGVNAAVCPDGTVYAFWEDYSGKKLWVDKSTNAGTTWGTDVKVHDYRINTPQFAIPIPPQPDRGIGPMPFSTCAPAGAQFAGRVYVVYTDKPAATSDTDVYLRSSSDGGATWSAEIKVNDDTVHAYQFHPAVTVGADGTVAVSFYDTRDDQPSNHKTNQYVAFSTNGGASFGPNIKVTTVQSDESGNGDPNDYGDYQGIDAAAVAGRYQQVWTDSRPDANAEDMYTARVGP